MIIFNGKRIVIWNKSLEGGGAGTPITVNTESGMTSVLENATAEDYGKVYKYTGITGTYENGAYYILEE